MKTEVASKRVRRGVVLKDKMEKTVVVEVTRRFRHPKYKKFVKTTSKFKVHDEKNECSINDVVRIMETRPMSKDKRWRLVEIVEKAK